MAMTQHGGDIFGVARRLDVPASNLLDFSASVSPLGLSSRAKRRLKRELDVACHYPDRRQEELRRIIAAQDQIDPECIVFGNGATQLLHLIPRCLQPRKALIPVPSFQEYRAALSCEVHEFPLRVKDGFCLSTAQFLRAMKTLRPDLIILANPNNPTGTLLPQSELFEILKCCAGQGTYCVLDESFIEFTSEMSFVREAVRQSRLIVVRSLTKFHALPGLRVGYLVAYRAVASRLSEQLEPWSVNMLALIAAAESLQDVAYRDRLLALVQKEREYLFTKLQELGWLQPFPSAANFLLVRIKAQGMMSGTILRLELEKHRILVRDASGFKDLGRQYVRIAVRRRRDNRMLIETLRTVGERRGLTARDKI